MLSPELDKITKQIVSRLRAHYPPQRVILFGSYARGNVHADSDLDLLIIKETDERFIDRWVAVRKILSDPFSRSYAEHGNEEVLLISTQSVEHFRSHCRRSQGDAVGTSLREETVGTRKSAPGGAPEDLG